MLKFFLCVATLLILSCGDDLTKKPPATSHNVPNNQPNNPPNNEPNNQPNNPPNNEPNNQPNNPPNNEPNNPPNNLPNNVPDFYTVEIIDGPPAQTLERSAEFRIRCEPSDCVLECSLNGTFLNSCPTTLSLSELPPGPKVFEVFASWDLLMMPTDSDRWEWTVLEEEPDPPEVINLNGPSDPTDSRTATFSFDCSQADCTFECRLDQGALQACVSGVTYGNLPDGDHEFEVRAVGATGLQSDFETWTWRVDATAPTVTNLMGPASPTSQRTATFTFGCSQENCTFECRLDGGSWQSCQSGHSVSGLGDGSHTMEVRASSALGVTGGASTHTWVVDTTPPVVTITSGPSGPTTDDPVVFTFQCNESPCTTACRLNGGTWQACVSPASYGGLAPGSYTFEVRGQDEAGNTGQPASRAFSIATPPVFAIAGKGSHICHLNDGDLQCWGNNFNRQLGTGNTEDSVRQPESVNFEDWSRIDAASDHTCGIRNGQLWCWGRNIGDLLGTGGPSFVSTPTRVGTASNWNEVTTGTIVFTCGLRDGQLWCWGNNGLGQLGLGDDTARTSPTRVGNRSDWEKVDGGTYTACGIGSGQLHCWGSNFEGVTGLGTSTGQTLTPTRVGTASNWSDVSVGALNACGIRNGQLWCWGANASGQVGDGTTTRRTTPTRVGTASDWSKVSAGNRFVCGLRGSGELYCWGRNHHGQLGLPAIEEVSTPTRVGTLSDWQDLAAGDFHLCARRSNGDIACAGLNVFGQIGIGTGNIAPTRTRSQDTSTQWSMVSTGVFLACGIKNGQLWCWGVGPVGDGTEIHRTAPVRIGAFSDWTFVTAGYRHACGIRANTRLYCWGDGYGLGIGQNVLEALSPQEVAGSQTGWTFASADGRTCGIRNGLLYCWGDGPVGDGTSERRWTPTQIGQQSNWSDVSVGYHHICASRNAGTFCWGTNDSGQAGTGSVSEPILSPQSVANPANSYTRLAAGWFHTCGIHSNNLYCWGAALHGGLGNGVSTDSTFPTPVLISSGGWTDIITSNNYSCGVRNGDLLCWGFNESGQLGFGDTTNRSTPTLVPNASGMQVLGTSSHNTVCSRRAGERLHCAGNNGFGLLGNGESSYRTLQVH